MVITIEEEKIMKKKQFLFTSLAIAAILSANVAYADEQGSVAADGATVGQTDPVGQSGGETRSSSGSLVVVTEEAAPPKVDEIVGGQTEVFTYDVNGETASLSTPALRLEKLDHPVVVTQRLTNQETGEVQSASTVAQNSNPYPYISADQQDLRPYAGFYYSNLPVGRYQSEFVFTDLEDKVLTVDAESQAKLAAYPVIEVKALQFVEPKLLSVTADKTEVKKGEEVTYTLTFDRSGFKSDKHITINLVSSVNDEYNNDGSSYIDHDGKLKVYYRAWKSGQMQLTFDEDYGYQTYSSRLNDLEKVAAISQETIDQLKALLPQVTVLDEASEEQTGVKSITLRHVKADGSEEVIPPRSLEWDSNLTANYQVLDLAAGDRLAYDIELEDGKAGGSAYAWFAFQGKPKQDADGNYHPDWETRYFDVYRSVDKTTDRFRLELPITANYYGSPDFRGGGLQDSKGNYLSDWHGKMNAYNGYIFNITNPKPVVGVTSAAADRELYYLGESPKLTVQLSPGIDLNQVSSIGLWLEGSTKDHSDLYLRPITEHKSILDADGNYVGDEEVLAEPHRLTDSYDRAMTVGRINYTKAVLYYKDGSEVVIDDFPGLSYQVSDEKKYLTNTQDPFLLSGQDKAYQPSSSYIWTSLGRVPEVLRNRALRTRKITLRDQQGELVTPTGTDLILHTNDLAAGSEVYYYLPLSGGLTKLTTQPYGSDQVLVSVTETTGLYIVAAPVGAETLNTANQSKVLSNTEADIYVRVSSGDINTVAAITTDKVTDITVLDKLPEDIKVQDIDLFDIKTLDKDGNFIQIETEATVTLPVAPGRKVTKVIYFLPETGAVEELPHEWSQELNQVIFNVKHFSNYGVVYEAQETEVPSQPEAPKTQRFNLYEERQDATGAVIFSKTHEVVVTEGGEDFVLPYDPETELLIAGINHIRYGNFTDGASLRFITRQKSPSATTVSPVKTTDQDIAADRFKLLLELNTSTLTDEQKGRLAETIPFAETAKDLAQAKAEFNKSLVAGSKTIVAVKPSADQTKSSDKSASAGLPATGEQSNLALVATGCGLLLASLGLGHGRKRFQRLM